MSYVKTLCDKMNGVVLNISDSSDEDMTNQSVILFEDYDVSKFQFGRICHRPDLYYLSRF